MISFLTKNKFTFLLFIAIVFLSFKVFEYKKLVKQTTEALSLADLKNQKFDTIVNEKNQQIATQKQVLLTKEQAIASQLLTIDELKKYKRIKSKVSVKTKTRIDTVFIAYDAPDSTTTSHPNLILPENYFRTFTYNEPDNWFNLKGTVLSKGVRLDSMDIFNEYSILIANKKNGLFKKSIPEVILTNKNPYTKTVSMNNIQVKYEESLFKKWWFWFVSGLGGGYLLLK